MASSRWLWAVLAATGAAALWAFNVSAQSAMAPDAGERCASRLSIALRGQSADASLFSSPVPQTSVEQIMQSTEFIERFSRFINATFNDEPGATSEEDAAYHLTRHILQNNLPWEKLFLGEFRMDVSGTGASATVQVTADANGLGYFRNKAWMERYAGNEPAGIRISTAYRMMQNTIGLSLVPATNSPDADVSATGRQAAGCRTCHFDNWYALDHVAAVLGKVSRNNNQISFSPNTEGPKSILGGLMISDDKQLVNALVKSDAFRFRACRLAFEFLYGRPEFTCEGPIFDGCMNEFKAKGTIQSAIAAVAKHGSFCQ